MKQVLLFAFLFLILFCAQPCSILAAAPAGGITVSPAIARIDLATDSPNSEITYTNNTKSELVLTIHAEDFKELEDNWKIKFINSNNTYKYSLASWIELNQNIISVPPQKSASFSVQINQDRLSPGAHYGAIVAQVSSPESGENISLNSAITSLVFVRNATGKEIEKAKFSFSPEINALWQLPSEITLSFENQGNVDLIPHGEIRIIDPAGTLVGKGIINDSSQIALPESIRRYESTIKQLSPILMPGQYKIKTSVHFGKSDRKISGSTSVLYFGPLVLFGIITAIILTLATALTILTKNKGVNSKIS